VFPSVCITILLLLVYALSAALTGALSGKLVSALLGVPTSGLLEDGFLGMVGFVLLGLALVFVPPLGDLLNDRFANSSIAALIAAPVLPSLRQLVRLGRYLWGSALAKRRLDQLRSQ
jgi:hypothetical protein